MLVCGAEQTLFISENVLFSFIQHLARPGSSPCTPASGYLVLSTT